CLIEAVTVHSKDRQASVLPQLHVEREGTSRRDLVLPELAVLMPLAGLGKVIFDKLYRLRLPRPVVGVLRLRPSTHIQELSRAEVAVELQGKTTETLPFQAKERLVVVFIFRIQKLHVDNPAIGGR